MYLINFILDNKYINGLLRRLGITGASFVEKLENGNSVLKLGWRSALGRRGELIQLKGDSVIYETVVTTGSWEKVEAQFLARNLKEDNLLLDFGANAGLISLETLKLTEATGIKTVLVEPIPNNATAIKFNLSEFEHEIIECALSDSDGKSTLYVRESNIGNSSLLEGAMSKADYSPLEVITRDVSTICSELLHGEARKIILKCDLEGYDARVLARMPDNFWLSISAAVIEVWAHPDVNKIHVAKVVSQLENFNQLSWDSDGKLVVTPSQLNAHWTSGSKKNLNLFAVR